jgi:hypothetical protein
MSRHIVAEHDDDVRLKRIGALDDGRDVIQRHPGIAGMDVGDDGDLETEVGRPLRRPKIVADDAEPQQGLDADPVESGSRAEGSGSTEETNELTPRDHGCPS